MTEDKLVPELRFPEFEGEWEKKKLGDLGKFYNGLRGKNKDYFVNGNKKYIQYLNIFQNTIIDNNFKDYNYVLVEDNENQNQVKYGDLLFTQSSETYEDIGMTSVYLGTIEIYLNSFSFGFRFDNPNDISFKYIAYLFESEFMRRKIIKEGQGSTRINLSSNRLKNINLPLPIKKEQEKIGGFFSKIDKKIELQEELIENLEEQKKGLMQKIFNQEVRFKDENGKDYPEWEEKKISEIFKESKLKMKDIDNKSYYDELLSVTLYEGIKKQSDLDYIDTSNQNKSNYKIVNKSDIVYNSMRMWQGASGMSKYNGIVSSAYVVLRPLENIEPRFIEYLFKEKKSIYEFYKRSQGMTSDTLTLRYNLIKDIRFLIPTIGEQRKIIGFLSKIDKKIELEGEILEEYKAFKKGLMQRMFI